MEKIKQLVAVISEISATLNAENKKQIISLLSELQNDILSTIKTEKRTCRIFTDGACSGNPGPGGFGVVMINEEEENPSETFSMGFSRTTNNRMELMAAIKALKMSTSYDAVEIISDSKYVTEAVNKGWIEKWKVKGFNSNPDLWKHFISLLQGRDVTFTWVKGHNGNKFNELADNLAVKAIKQNLVPDKGYELLN